MLSNVTNTFLAISILAGNLNLGRSYLITTVLRTTISYLQILCRNDIKRCFSLFVTSQS